MAMKLLNKDEIAKAQNADRAKEISEGLKISRRVDSLRELQASEERALSKFREESLALISEEIKELTKKKENILEEIRQVQADLQNETTLTREERQNLEKLKAELEIREKEIDDKSLELDLRETDIHIALKEAKDSVIRAKGRESRSEELQRKATLEEQEISQRLSRARKMEENTVRFKEETELSLSLERAELEKEKEKTSSLQEENLQKSRELEVEKKQLADQRKTLERAMERLRKNGLA